MTRREILITVCILLAAVTACSRGLNDSQTNAAASPSKPTQVSAPKLSLSEEAQKEAQKYWNSKFTKCGEAYYADFMNFSKTEREHLIELKDMTMVVQEEGLTEADRLNGIEWKGRTEVNVTAERTFRNNSWGEWKPGAHNPLDGRSEYRAALQKKNKSWTFAGLGFFGLAKVDDLKAAQCGTIPGRAGQVTGTVHVEGIGDMPVALGGAWSGTKGQSRRLEGFALRIDPPIAGLTLRYQCRIQDTGDSPWVKEGEYCGTRGESRRLEGFAIKLEGAQAQNFNVHYQAHLERSGNSEVVQNGQFCGTQDQPRRVEAIRAWIEPRASNQ